jgi:hypothetical protein
MENIWKAEYEARRMQWKKKACEFPVPSMQTSPSASSPRAVLNDGSGFRVNQPTNHSDKPFQPCIQSSISPAAEPTVDIDKLIDEFTLNREQARAFKIVAEHSKIDKPAPLRMYLGEPVNRES